MWKLCRSWVRNGNPYKNECIRVFRRLSVIERIYCMWKRNETNYSTVAPVCNCYNWIWFFSILLWFRICGQYLPHDNQGPFQPFVQFDRNLKMLVKIIFTNVDASTNCPISGQRNSITEKPSQFRKMIIFSAIVHHANVTGIVRQCKKEFE